MQVNVSQLLKESIGSARDHRVRGSADIYGNGITSLVQGEVRLTRTNRGIMVKGTLQTEVEVNCSRCLGRFSRPLILNIEEEHFPIIDVVSGAPLSSPDEPGCFTIDEHHILDLAEATRQYTLLAIPMKPLCHKDCAGLCPSCGHNLNQGACNCSSQTTDPRWSALRKLALANKERKGTE